MEEVSDYEHHGSIITNDGKLGLGIANRALKATRLYYALNSIIPARKEIEYAVKMIILLFCVQVKTRQLNRNSFHTNESQHDNREIRKR